MRVFRSFLLVLTPLLCLSLPSAALEGTGVESQTNHGDSEVLVGDFTGTTIVTSSWPSLLTPSYIFEGLQNAYLPPALRAMRAVQAFVAPRQTSYDFWTIAMHYEQTLQDYIPRMLKSAEDYFRSTAFTDVIYAMKDIVRATTAFRIDIQEALDRHQVTLDLLTGELEYICMAIVRDLEKVPLPSKAPSHAERDIIVDRVLGVTEMALVDIAIEYGIKEDVVTAYLDVLRPRVRALTVAVGDINEQYPQLLPALAFGVAGLLVPEMWLLRPILSVLGFGPYGPIKGSTAAWIQRLVWGAAVAPRSWFSWLQAAGMGVIPKWGGFSGAPIVVGGLSALLLPCFCILFCCCLLRGC